MIVDRSRPPREPAFFFAGQGVPQRKARMFLSGKEALPACTDEWLPGIAAAEGRPSERAHKSSR